jgi:F0F1-type ATP synthase assembly protein I
MAPEDKEETNRKSGLAYAAALSLFFSVAILAVLGLLLDRWIGASPWFTVGGLILGTVVGFYQFIKLSSQLS